MCFNIGFPISEMFEMVIGGASTGVYGTYDRSIAITNLRPVGYVPAVIHIPVTVQKTLTLTLIIDPQ